MTDATCDREGCSSPLIESAVLEVADGSGSRFRFHSLHCLKLWSRSEWDARNPLRPPSQRPKPVRMRHFKKPSPNARRNECGHVDAAHYARGRCSKCYDRDRLAGLFLLNPCVECGTRNASGGSDYCRPCGNRPALLGIPTRFWHYVTVVEDVPSDDPCWMWSGNTNWQNGTMWTYKDRTLVCQTVTFEMFHGRKVQDDCLISTCGYRRCVNPTHLRESSFRAAIDASRGLPESSYRGVSRNGTGWAAQSRDIRGETVRIGSYDTAEAAADAYRLFVEEEVNAANRDRRPRTSFIDLYESTSI